MDFLKLLLFCSIVFLIIAIIWCEITKALPPQTYYDNTKVEYCVEKYDNVEYKDLDGVVYVENTGECSYR